VFGQPLLAEMLVVSLVSDSNSWAVALALSIMARVSEENLERAVQLVSLMVELMMLKLVRKLPWMLECPSAKASAETSAETLLVLVLPMSSVPRLQQNST